MWGDVAIAFLLAFIVAFMATPYTIKIAHKIGAVDVPKDERRMHKKAMPSGNTWIFSVSNIFINSYDNGRYNKFNRAKWLWYAVITECF